MSAVRRSQTAATIRLKPTIEPFACIMRQRSLRRNAERFLHDLANRRKIDNRVRKFWHRATDSAEQIDIAEDFLAQRQAIPFPARVKHFAFQQREIYIR